MPTLSEIAATESFNDGNMPDVEIPTFDPMLLLQAQAAFGALIMGNPDMTRLVNAYGPALFATVLFTTCEDYQVDPNDEDNLIAGNSVVEAEQKAIGILRGVASAFGRMTDEVTVEPSDAEIDADTELNPV